MIQPRLNVVTLGVPDLRAVRSFYERLGWTSHSEVTSSPGSRPVAATLALFPADKLAAEALAGQRARRGFRGFTMAVVVSSAEEVDAPLAAVRDAGGRTLGEPVQRECGGRSGYFADPEDNVWEVAWLPNASFRDGGTLIWP